MRELNLREIISSEWRYLVVGLVGLWFFLGVGFYKNPMATLKLALALSFGIYIPGYLISILLPLDRLARILLGMAVAIGVLGIGSYYLGYFGVHVKYHVYVVVGLEMVVLCSLLYWKYGRRRELGIVFENGKK